MLNLQIDGGETSLHKAARHAHVETVAFLMTFEELDHKIADENGETSLHRFAKFGFLKCVKALLEASRFSKKDVKMEYLEMKTKDGSMAIDLARKNNKTEVVEVGSNFFFQISNDKLY